MLGVAEVMVVLRMTAMSRCLDSCIERVTEAGFQPQATCSRARPTQNPSIAVGLVDVYESGVIEAGGK